MLSFERGVCLSRTCVAPKDLRKSTCLVEEVVMMGSKPEVSPIELLRRKGRASEIPDYVLRLGQYLTKLTDGAGSSKDNEGRIGVFSLSVCFDRRLKTHTVGLDVIQPNVRSGQGERKSCGLIVRNVGWNLTDERLMIRKVNV